MTAWIPIIAVVLSLLLAFRVWLHFDDKKRIAYAAGAKRWTDIAVVWAPFAPGWFFEGQERHYRVQFKDESGRGGVRYCKIRLFGDIYWRD